MARNYEQGLGGIPSNGDSDALSTTPLKAATQKPKPKTLTETKIEMAALLPQKAPDSLDAPSQEVQQGYAANGMPLSIGNSPSIIIEGLKRNPKAVLAKGAAGALFPNAYQAYKENRLFPGVPAGATLDAASFVLSPIKSLQLAGKAAGLNNAIFNPVAKSAKHMTNVKNLAKREAGTGVLDNLVYDVIGDALDDRSKSVGEYLLSGAVGAGAGAGSGVAQAFKAKEGLNQTAKYVAAHNHKKQVEEGRRNSYNDTEDNLETFMKLVNEQPPLTTTGEHKKIAESKKNLAANKLEKYLDDPEAHVPLNEFSLSNLQKKLVDKLDNDFSGNLTQSEKDLVLKNFMDDAVDMLKSINPAIRETSRAMPEDLFNEAIGKVPLSIKDINKLRQMSGNKTTLVTPTKAGYVRAGEDNRGMNEYYKLYKDALYNMGTNPDDISEIVAKMTNLLPNQGAGASSEKIKEIKDVAQNIINGRIEKGKRISELNRDFAKAKSNEELITSVLTQQGKGSPLESHYPFLIGNPEINPTIISNKPLKGRNIANKTKDVINAGMQANEEMAANEEVAKAISDGEKLGLIGKDLENYIRSRFNVGLGKYIE